MKPGRKPSKISGAMAKALGNHLIDLSVQALVCHTNLARMHLVLEDIERIGNWLKGVDRSEETVDDIFQKTDASRARRTKCFNAHKARYASMGDDEIEDLLISIDARHREHMGKVRL